MKSSIWTWKSGLYNSIHILSSRKDNHLHLVFILDAISEVRCRASPIPCFNMRTTLILTIFVVIQCTSVLSVKRYYGYKLLNIKKAVDKSQLDALINLQKQLPDLDFWSDPSLTRNTDILVAPNEVPEVEKYLVSNGFQYDVHNADIQALVEQDRQRTARQSVMSWKAYHRLDTIHAWLDQLTIQNPQLVHISSLGRSSENRDIKLVKVSTGGYKRKPRIYVDAGIHAREWIGPATVTYIMNQLLSIRGSRDLDLLTDVDWYFVPVVNPDGYEYSHTEDRLWRKTRSRHNGERCVGVDLNRNFDFHWGEVGVKLDPCSNTYPGPYAFSEPEANATANFLYQHRNRIQAYLTFHSYSQLWLTPYGYSDDLPDDFEELKELGDRAVKVLETVHGTEYEVGAPSQILYKNSGSSRDWAKGVAEIKYPYTIELPDKGDVGFLLPPNEIEPTAEETWEAVKVVARHLLKEYPYEK